MAYDKFIPEVWAKTFNTDLEKATVFGENTNQKYEGLAKKPGDSIKILGVGKPNLRNFSDGKLHTLDSAETIEDLSMTLPIMQVSDFHFNVDDLDKRQAEGGDGLLGMFMKEAKNQVAERHDSYIAGLVADKQVVKVTKADAPTVETVLDIVDEAFVKLLENDVSRNEEITITAPPWFTLLLKRAKIELDTANSDMLRNGRIGRYSGIVIKESNNVFNDGTYDNIQIKTNNAISFVKPYLHLEAYRPEGNFSDAVKGYSLYDGKVTRPKEIINLKVKRA